MQEKYEKLLHESMKHEIEIAGPNSERNSKLRTYKIFGANQAIPLRFKDRPRLTKFRSSDHNLEIEVGRHYFSLQRKII